MTNSTYAQPLPAEYHQNASAAYDSEGNIIDGLWHNYPEQAAAGLWLRLPAKGRTPRVKPEMANTVLYGMMNGGRMIIPYFRGRI
jgi:hypothetical protein